MEARVSSWVTMSRVAAWALHSESQCFPAAGMSMIVTVSLTPQKGDDTGGDGGRGVVVGKDAVKGVRYRDGYGLPGAGGFCSSLCPVCRTQPTKLHCLSFQWGMALFSAYCCDSGEATPLQILATAARCFASFAAWCGSLWRRAVGATVGGC
jgi:hypothetical protein